MVQFLPMPAIAFPQNAMLNFQPMNQALQFYAQNQLDRGRFGLQQNADVREQEMHPLRMDQTRAQTNLGNAHAQYYLGQDRRADILSPEEVRLRRSQAGAHDAHAALYRAQADASHTNAMLGQRRMDSLQLQRDRGFALQTYRLLQGAQTPQQFESVADMLAPVIGYRPRWDQRHALSNAALSALEEYDVVAGPDGQPQQVSRGFAPGILPVAAGGGANAMRPQLPAPQQSPAAPAARPATAGIIMDAVSNPNPVLADSFRRMGFPVPRADIAPNGALSGVDTNQLFQALPGSQPAPQGQQQPQQPPAGPSQGRPVIGPLPQAGAPPAPGAAVVVPIPNGPGGLPQGRVIMPVAAPGGMVPPVIGGPQGAVPVQDGGAGRPVPAIRGGAAGARQAAVNEIEQQYGAPATWGQNGSQPPPFSVIQRYWQSVHGGRPQSGMQYNADGSVAQIPGSPARGRGGSGGSNAAANAAEVLASTVPQIQNAAEYILNSNVVTNALGQMPGAQMAGVTGFNNARSTLEFGTSAIMHSLSGATTTQREFERYVQAFLPNWSDLDNVRRYKLNSLMLVLRTVQARSAGGSVNDETMRPVRELLLRQQRELLGLSSGNSGSASPAPGGRPAPGGWGGASGMSTQDIINSMNRR